MAAVVALQLSADSQRTAVPTAVSGAGGAMAAAISGAMGAAGFGGEVGGGHFGDPDGTAYIPKFCDPQLFQVHSGMYACYVQ